MAKVGLAIAAIADLALAALLIGVSGFLFGSGPESMHGGALFMTAYVAGIIACVAAPIVGFVFNGRRKTGAGLAIAWLPIVCGLIALMIPAPY